MHPIHTLSAALLLSLSLSGCGAPDPDDPESMARERPPEHNPDATYEGRTALQHAERLNDLSWVQQREALRVLEAMGVDALPAREAVRDTLESAATRDLDSNIAGDLALSALGTLAAMRAPEAPALVRERIVDPDFSDRTAVYGSLIFGAVQMGIEPATLTADVTPLAASEPDHALRLLETGNLPDEANNALAQALFATDHNDRAAQYFLGNMSVGEFIGDAEILAYVRERPAAARDASRPTQALLAAIGTEEAFELALEINETTIAESPRLVSEFARSNMGPERAMALLLDEAMAADTPQAINAHLDAMARVSRDLINAGSDGESQGTPDATVHELHLHTLGRLLSEGRTADHHEAAIEQLSRYVQRNQEVPITPALDPVFEIARASDTRSETRVAAQRSLQRIQAERNPQFYYSETVNLLWAGTDAASTEIPQAILTQARNAPEHAALVIEHLGASVDDNMDTWAVNPAAAVAMNLAAIRQFDRSDRREQGAILVGRLIASPRAELRFLEPHLRQHAGALVNFDNNSIAGMIGLLGPTIFAEHQAVHREFEPAAFASVMGGQPRWFRDQPEAVTQWKEFLQQVIDADRAHFSAAARSALDAL